VNFPSEICTTLTVVVLFIFSITSVGVACVGRVLSSTTNPLFLPLAIACGIVGHALIGLLIVASPADKRIIAAALLMAANLAALTVNVKGRATLAASMGSTAWPMGLWIGTSVFYVLVTFFPVRLPATFTEGLYIMKTDTLPVRIQALVGDLPIDNQIPDVVTEYLLRGISFAKNHPIVPGQEVSDRPFLLPLVVVPVRALLGPVASGPPEVPKFTYVGTDWPNYSLLLTDGTFRQFLAVAIPLNATMVLAVWYLGRALAIRRLLPLIAITLVILSPYEIIHTIFTWPKNLAAMFVLLATLVTFYRQPAWIAGFLMGLGYWSHPYALVFAGALGLHFLVEHRAGRATLASVISYAIAFALMIAPWLIWTRFFLGIPSDLIEQNFNSRSGWVSQIWIRLYNLCVLLFPGAFNTPYFSPVTFAHAITISLAGMVGILFFLPGLFAIFYYLKQYRQISIYGILIPGLLLVAVFSAPAVPAMHGWQTITPIILLLALKLLQEMISETFLITLIMTQFGLNLAIIAVYAVDRLPNAVLNH
jgi:hypothetical protein